MKITTKKGDYGKSNTLKNSNISKDELIFEVIGNIDELNSFIGFARSMDNTFHEQLEKIQKFLNKVSSYVACDGKHFKEDVEEFLRWTELEIERNEEKINLKQFIIFGDDETSSRIDLCRVVCRKCERRIVSLIRKNKWDNLLIKAFNRLSDLLFIYAVLELRNKQGN